MYDDEAYHTGYGKPPVRTRFQKGVSGNPNGRPKGSKSLASIFRKITHEKVQVNGPHGPRYISKLEAGITQLVNRAAKGDPKDRFQQIRRRVRALSRRMKSRQKEIQQHSHCIDVGRGGD